MAILILGVLYCCLLLTNAVPIEKSTNQQQEQQNPAGTLQIKITGIYDSEPDKPVETSPSFLDSSESEELEDRNSSKTPSHGSNDSMAFVDNSASNEESMSIKKKEKNEKDNVKQMIMSVLGMEDESNQTRDPRREIESDESSSLVQKLMEGSMVITAQEDNKKEMPIIQSNQSSAETSQHFYRNVTQPLNLVINFYTSSHRSSSALESDDSAMLKGGVYPPEVKMPKRDIRPSKCHFNGSIYDNGEMVKTNHPCDQCQCRHGRVSCFWQQCDGAPGFQCVPLFIPGSCCPVYSCQKDKLA